MKDVNGVEIKESMQVVDLSVVDLSIEMEYPPLQQVLRIVINILELDNGKLIKGGPDFTPVVVIYDPVTGETTKAGQTYFNRP